VIIYPFPAVYIVYPQSGVNTALNDVEDYLVSGFFPSPTVLGTEHHVSKIDVSVLTWKVKRHLLG